MKSKFLHAIKQTHTHTYIHTNASTSALLITNFQFLFLTAAAAFQIYTACNEQVRMLWQAGRQAGRQTGGQRTKTNGINWRGKALAIIMGIVMPQTLLPHLRILQLSTSAKRPTIIAKVKYTCMCVQYVIAWDQAHVISN